MYSGVLFNGIPLEHFLRLRDIEKLGNWRSEHAWLDHDACHAIHIRMAEAATKRQFLDYRQLVDGVVFSGSTAKQYAPNDGRIDFGQRLPYETRLFIEDFLIYISAATFRDGEVLMGAMVRDDANLGHAAASLEQWAQLVERKSESVDARAAKKFWDAEAEKTFDLYSKGTWREEYVRAIRPNGPSRA